MSWNWNLFRVIIMTGALISLGFDWYNGVQHPAWVAFIWCFCVFLDDLIIWMEEE